MILIIRDNECFEPRIQNYMDYFEKHTIDYHILAWNRNGKAKRNSRITFFEKRAKYGQRVKNIPNKIFWMLFVAKEITKNRKKYSIIHACDIDAILPALLVGKIFNKKVIWDIFDWLDSPSKTSIVYKIVNFFQNYCYKKADYIILCEEERKQQAEANNKNILVLPNIPNDVNKFDNVTLQKIQKQKKVCKLTISYVGVFDRDRGLETLLEVISKRDDILLNIAGFGVLGDLVNEYSSKYPNIQFWGRVDYEVGQSIMKSSDIIIAMYYLSNPIHKYAAPNKYYESLYLGVPMITTENTLVGSKVKKYNTGFVISETREALAAVFDSEELEKSLIEKKENCSQTWQNVYVSYYEDFMREKYLKVIE